MAPFGTIGLCRCNAAWVHRKQECGHGSNEALMAGLAQEFLDGMAASPPGYALGPNGAGGSMCKPRDWFAS